MVKRVNPDHAPNGTEVITVALQHTQKTYSASNNIDALVGHQHLAERKIVMTGGIYQMDGWPRLVE